MPFATTRVGLEHIMLTEVCQTKIDKYCMISLICGIQKAKTIATTKTREQKGGYQGMGARRIRLMAFKGTNLE